jgi:hypothetical protein
MHGTPAPPSSTIVKVEFRPKLEWQLYCYPYFFDIFGGGSATATPTLGFFNGLLEECP